MTVLRPVSTKQFFLTYINRETDVRKKNCLSGHGLFANRPADTVSSLPSDRWLTLAYNTNHKRRTGKKSAQWTLALYIIYDICDLQFIWTIGVPHKYVRVLIKGILCEVPFFGCSALLLQCRGHGIDSCNYIRQIMLKNVFLIHKQ